jgi:DNA polymerase III delta prime subunit
MSNIPWTELLRPKKIDDILGKCVRKKLISLKKNKELPNLILCGNSGLGKTSSILALAKELIQDENYYKKQILELNASDERGIDIVRNKIRMFTNKKVINENFPQKIIILDEADNLTNSAQQALRYLMSEFVNVCFVLSCNSLNLIVEPIQSRCQIIKYTKIDEDEIKNYVFNICNKFDLKLNEEIRDLIIEKSNSDMRVIINQLQKFNYYQKIGLEITNKMIKNEQDYIYEIIDKLYNKRLNDVFDLLKVIISNGDSIYDIINNFIEVIIKFDIDYDKKFQILELISKFKINYTEGLVSDLQLHEFIVNLYLVINE